MIIGFRWFLVRMFLCMARSVAVKDCDYGDRLTASVDGFFFYVGHGRER